MKVFRYNSNNVPSLFETLGFFVFVSILVLVLLSSRNAYSQSPEGYGTGFDSRLFLEGDVLLSLYEGDYSGLNQMDQHLLNIYLSHLNLYFSGENEIDQNCSHYGKSTISNELHRRAMRNAAGDSESVEEIGMNALKSFAQLFQQSEQSGGTDIYNRARQIDHVQSAAPEDGARLASSYGCSSPVFKRLYKNFEIYVSKY